MSHLEPLGVELQTIWRREIPLATAIGIEVLDTRDELAVGAPLEPNRNLHGTAFAGSLFSVCVLTGWGATWLALRRAGQNASIVVRDSRIRYRKAVEGPIVCRCRPDAAELESALEELATAGRCTLELACALDPTAAPSVLFEGTYVVHAPRGR